ncbi:MAG: hypothetical protein KGM24_11255, partial [Elusimicrobia bacterium]|nr:hypothetical protein [Elusimicrobiota bacterium]
MKIARGLFILLFAVSAAGAATIDFDGSSGIAPSLPSFAPARRTPRRAPRRAPRRTPRRPAPPPAAAS